MMCRRRLAVVGLAASLGVVAQAGQDGGGNELDRFMEQVLANRAASAAARLQYVLDETSELRLTGPDATVLWGSRGEYTWYEQDGVFVRSPTRLDGVTLSDAERRAYEADWLEREAERARRRRNDRVSPARWSSRSMRDNVRLTIERTWGGGVGDDLLDAIAAQGRGWNDAQAAVVAATDRIVASRGGVMVVGFARTVAEARAGFVLLDEGRLVHDEVAGMLDGVVVHLLAASPAATDVEFRQLVELFDLAVARAVRLSPLDPEVLDRIATTHPERAASLREADRALQALRAMPRGESATGPADPAWDALEPRFVADAFFLDFEFEPGRYYLVGREALDGHEVVRIEYYPEQMFGEDPASGDSPATDGGDGRDRRREQAMDKVSLVTLWVDPVEQQIVRYTFDNLGFDFLPGRWLFRLDDVTASMTMRQPFDGVWLPAQVDVQVSLSLASGRYELRGRRTYSNHRQAESGGRIRSAIPPGR